MAQEKINIQEVIANLKTYRVMLERQLTKEDQEWKRIKDLLEDIEGKPYIEARKVEKIVDYLFEVRDIIVKMNTEIDNVVMSYNTIYTPEAQRFLEVMANMKNVDIEGIVTWIFEAAKQGKDPKVVEDILGIKINKELYEHMRKGQEAITEKIVKAKTIEEMQIVENKGKRSERQIMIDNLPQERRRIYEIIKQEQPVTYDAIAEIKGCAAPTVINHALKLLKEGLVRKRKIGLKAHYEIVNE